MINHEILIVHGVGKSDFLMTQIFSGITALTAFNRKANGVNGVNGVFFVGIKALTAFCL